MVGIAKTEHRTGLNVECPDDAQLVSGGRIARLVAQTRSLKRSRRRVLVLLRVMLPTPEVARSRLAAAETAGSPTVSWPWIRIELSVPALTKPVPLSVLVASTVTLPVPVAELAAFVLAAMSVPLFCTIVGLT